MGMRRPGTFYDWVDGKQLPSLDYLPDLVRVLGMTAEELMGIAAGQNPPFATWHVFLAGLEARGEKLTEGERAALAGLPWPSGREPTVTSYEMALAAIRTAAPSG